VDRSETLAATPATPDPETGSRPAEPVPETASPRAVASPKLPQRQTSRSTQAGAPDAGARPSAPPRAAVGEAPPPRKPASPVRVGGAIQPPVKIKHVAPAYPPLARSANVEGTVIIEATIGTDGLVHDAKVLRSIALLDRAALDAVRQWQYSPTRLNGVLVPVVMTVTVSFSLR
jgi:periplasmic protein TonB